MKREKLLAVLLMGLFIVLSLLSIGRFSPWHDESYSATLIEGSYSDIVSRTALDVHPPFYYLVLKAWSSVFGSNILALRAFSIVCMVGAIFIAWRLLRRQFGAAAGLIGLAGMAAGPFLIRYSQEIRMYALGALLAMAATYILWWLLQKSISKRAVMPLIVCYSAIMTLAVYTHYFLAFLLFAHALFVVSYYGGVRKVTRRWWLMFGAPLVLFGAWLPTAIDQFRQVKGAFWIGPFKVESLSSSIINFFMFRQEWELRAWAAVFGVLLIVSAVAIFWRWRVPGYSDKKLITYVLIVPMLLLVLASLPPLQPAYQDRYISFYAPLLYGAMAMATVAWWQVHNSFIRRLPVVIIAAAVVIGLFSVSALGNNQGWRPEPYFTADKIANFIKQRQPNSQVVSTSLWTFLDAHVTIGKDLTTQLYTPNGAGKYGNWSAIYDRPELQVNNLNSLNSSNIWLIEEAKQPALKVPKSWRVDTLYQEGYARATLYRVK